MRYSVNSQRFAATATLCAVVFLLCGADGEDSEAASLKLTAGEASIEGALDAEIVERVVGYYLRDLQSCVTEAGKDKGEIILRWFISTGGTMEEVEIRESTVESDEVGDCLVDHIGKWTFPEPRPEERIELVQRFALKSTDDVTSADDPDSAEAIEDAAAIAAFSGNPPEAATGEPDIQGHDALTALDDKEGSSADGPGISGRASLGDNSTDDQPAIEPRVTPGQPTVDGGLDKRIVQRVTRQNRREVLNCYEQRVREEPDLSGEVIIKWVIATTGDVISAEISESELDDEAVEDCITSRIERWAFPEPDGGEIVEVNYPFEFDVED